MRLLLAIVLLAGAGLAPAPSPPADTVWPQFRGAFGRGVADIDSLPIRWSTTKNVAWKASVPGRGWSSADRVARSSDPHVHAQPRRVQAAVNGNLRQRLRRGADEAGVVGRRGAREAARTRYRIDRG